jgi:hypothetical protein
MIQPFRSTLPARQTAEQRELRILESFDYASLDAGVVCQVQIAAQRIRQMVKRTLEDLIAVGNNLLAVREALPYGQFGPWLRAEFGWTERTARNFMIVAQRFGPKAEILSELSIEPTAAYLLAAPSAPQEASVAALERAQRGERITASVAREILNSFRKEPERRESASSVEVPAGRLWRQLLEVLESFRRQWDPRQVSVLARQLRDFADSLEEKQEGS